MDRLAFVALFRKAGEVAPIRAMAKKEDMWP
jgi:hypothetical protein